MVECMMAEPGTCFDVHTAGANLFIELSPSTTKKLNPTMSRLTFPQKYFSMNSSYYNDRVSEK